VNCHRRCVHGYLGTEEIHDYSSNEPGEAPEITEGRIIMHLEFCDRTGQRTRVRLCPCQTREDK
jgi:hypothetical protein